MLGLQEACKLSDHNRGVEQLAARRAHNPEVTGSNPVPATKTLRVSFTETLFLFNSKVIVRRFDLFVQGRNVVLPYLASDDHTYSRRRQQYYFAQSFGAFCSS